MLLVDGGRGCEEAKEDENTRQWVRMGEFTKFNLSKDRDVSIYRRVFSILISDGLEAMAMG